MKLKISFSVSTLFRCVHVGFLGGHCFACICEKLDEGF